MPQPDNSTITSYDAFAKVNDQNLPPTVPTVDWQNPLLAQGVSDIAAIGTSSPRFNCRITLAATTGALVLVYWDAVWANATSTIPTLSRTSTGLFTITTPSVVSDEYFASVGIINNHTVNLHKANANFEGTTFGFINCSASGNVITLNTANTSGSANDMVGVTVSITAR
jgi:hypothetical protein